MFQDARKQEAVRFIHLSCISGQMGRGVVRIAGGPEGGLALFTELCLSEKRGSEISSLWEVKGREPRGLGRAGSPASRGGPGAGRQGHAPPILIGSFETGGRLPVAHP